MVKEGQAKKKLRKTKTKKKNGKLMMFAIEIQTFRRKHTQTLFFIEPN